MHIYSKKEKEKENKKINMSLMHHCSHKKKPHLYRIKKRSTLNANGKNVLFTSNPSFSSSCLIRPTSSYASLLATASVYAIDWEYSGRGWRFWYDALASFSSLAALSSNN